ncbi:MAG TPA: adenosylmethionine decarboxylase [Steroidobacteraceae bacterium]
MSPVIGAVGNHILADLYGIDAALLRDGPALESLLRKAAVDAGARVLSSHFHSFGAEAGITGVILLAESHISIHTWPECGMAAVDIFMCGAGDAERALEFLVRQLVPTDSESVSIGRGRHT